MKITFIGFGEAARAFCDSLQATGRGHSFAAFDRITSPEMAEAMAARATRQAATPGEAVTGADWIISAVTADQSLIAAQSVADYVTQGQIFIDINSVSPDRKKKTAEVLAAHHAGYLDMAVMAPVHPKGHATPVLTAGSVAESLHETLLDLGFVGEVVGSEPGEATAVKMLRSLFVKGLEAITVECALAAVASGVYDRVIGSLQRSYPGLDWPDNVIYNFERTMRHGTRRAAEMRESAATLDALGLTGDLAMQISAVQDKMGALPLTELPEGDTVTSIRKVACLRNARLS